MNVTTLGDTSRAAARRDRVELTFRGILLGAVITLIFTAANVYLGLKVGLTIASSIPAAVISMALLRNFKNSTIYENNIVQTVASAAGTLSSIIFVLPGLVMVGWWTHFPFWQSFGICAAGGILGVMYTVPLRRALVSQSDLPYPEGIAAAEVLKVGSRDGIDGAEPTAEAVAENRAGLIAVVGGSIASAAFAAVGAMRVFVIDVAGYVKLGAASTGFGGSLSLALIGAGHLIGLAVGIAIFVGLFISWGIATPLLTILHPMPGAAADVASATWAHQVRFIGAGTIGISAIWTLAKLARPVWVGVLSSIAASRRRASGEGDALPITERDIPIGIVVLVSVACLIPITALFASFLWGGALAPLMVPLIIGAVIYVVIAGFLVASAAGYMAGLIGSSNSPISGLAILTVIGATLLLLAMAKSLGPSAAPTLVAFCLFVTATVINVATIANDNLQDLKTGQLVNATPWRQQAALIVGVVMGALVIPPILDLLNRAYGFAGGSTAHIAANPLPAPQATLISALAKGVIQGQLDWGLIGIGALIGLGIIAIDEILQRIDKRYKLPPLAVGLGIYLPFGATSPAVLGALIGWGYNRWVKNGPHAEAARRLGVLMASGMIVGESLFGVLLAGLIVVFHKDNPLAVVGDAFQGIALPLGLIAFAGLLVALYAWVGRMGSRLSVTTDRR